MNLNYNNEFIIDFNLRTTQLKRLMGNQGSHSSKDKIVCWIDIFHF